MRILKSMVVVMLLLAGVLAAVRFYFLDQTLIFVLQKAGAEDIRVQGVEVGLKQVSVAELGAVFELPTGGRVNVELSNVFFDYDLPQLLNTARFEKCEVERMDVSLWLEGKQKAGLPIHLPVRIALVKEHLRARIPVEEILVRKLQFHGDVLPQLRGKSIRISAAVEERLIRAELILNVSSGKHATVSLRSPDPYHSTAKIVLQKTGGPKLEVDVSLLPECISVRTDLELAILMDFVVSRNSGLLADISRGVLAATVTVPWEGSEKKDIEFVAVLKDVAGPGGEVGKVRLQLSGNVENGGVSLNESSFVDAGKIEVGQMKLGRLRVGLAGGGRQSNGQQELHFSGQQKVVLDDLQMDDFRIDKLDLSFADPLQIFTGKGHWEVADNKLYCSPFSVFGNGVRVDIGPVTGAFSGLQDSFGETGIRADMQVSDAVFSNEQQGLAVKDISAILNYNGDQVHGKVLFSPKDVPSRLQLKGQHDLDTGRGSVVLETKEALEFVDGGPGLSALLAHWDYPGNLDTGSLDFRVTGGWGRSGLRSAVLQAGVKGGNGYYQNVLFKGLEFHQDLTVFPVMASNRSGSFFLERLIGGVDMTAIRAGIDLLPSRVGPLPVLQIHELNAELFDGRVSSSEIRLDLNQPDSAFVVKLDDMDLKTMVDLIKMDSLHVTGKVSGSIPVTVKDREVTVVGGELRSESPGGEIRYTPASAGRDGETGYALKAVENLQYSTLTVTAGYKASGQLDLDISLLGMSPGLDTTRPVQLNIHAEQNLPALLQSLRFSKGLTEELDKRVKQHYN